MTLPKLNEEGSSTALVSSLTYWNMLNSEQISRNAKYLECIPDPGTGPNSESIANPDPSTKSIEI